MKGKTMKTFLSLIFALALTMCANAQEVIVYREIKICNEANIQRAKERQMAQKVVAKPQTTRYKSVNVEYDNGQYTQSRTRTFQSSGPFFNFSSRMGCSTSG